MRKTTIMNSYNRINGWLQASLVFSSLLLSLNIAAAGTWKFVSIADTQSGLTPTNAVNTNVCIPMARQIVNERPDFVLIPGDLILGADPGDHAALLAEYAQWTNAFSSIYSAGIPIYPVRGNHEIYGDDTNGTVYLSVFGASVPSNGPAGEVGLTYSFAHNNALIIGLDQYTQPHQVNQPWLDNQLASNRYAHIFVFGHEPAVQVVEPECLADETDARDLFLKSITEAGCRMYLCAHDHFYNRGRLMPKSGGSIMQVISGAGGAPFETDWDGIYGQNFGEQAMGSKCYYSTLTNGYVLVTVSNFNVTLEWKGSADLETWTTYDTYSYQVTNPAIRNPTDYDGDSKADPAAYNSASGLFTIFMSGSSYTSASVRFPQSPVYSLQPSFGDYDGDGKADPAVYDPMVHQLLARFSSQAYSLGTLLIGDSSCVPVSGDFDGDAKADPALYSASSGLLTVWLSGSSYSTLIVPLGGAGWLNASADYDGDGKTDPAIYQAASGTWQVLLSGNGYAPSYLVTVGGVGVVPAPGDYDGDGKADLADYQPTTGLWLVALSGQNYAQNILNGFASSTFLASPGDYDGDGKTDPAVYAPGLNAYCVWMSGSGYNTAVLSW